MTPVSFGRRHNYTYNCSSKTRDDKEEAGKRVVTGGGAVAATTTAARTKAVKSGFSMFDSAERVSRGITGVTDTTRTVTSVAKKTNSLWARVTENAKWAKNAILNWGTKFKNLKYVKPIIESPVFKHCAGALGYGFGFVTLISGLVDIAKFTTENLNENLDK